MSNVEQPYIFISYSHKDKDLIYPFISALKEKYAVWFDEGIHYGREWEEEIAAKLDECSIFLFAVTENSLNSANCRDELNLARDNNKQFLNVMFRDNVELPGWFKLRFGRYQMCFYTRFPSAQAVVEDLGKKCDWFKDVRLRTAQIPTKAVVEEPTPENSANEHKAVEGSLRDKPISASTDDEFYALLGDIIKKDSTSDAPKSNASKNKPESEPGKPAEKSVNINIPSTENVNATGSRIFTRQQITEAFEYANRREKERPKKDNDTPLEFVCCEELKESKISNAVNKYASTANKDEVVALCDSSIFGSGKEGVLITETELYARYLFRCNPVCFAKIHSIELINEKEILFTYIDSTKEKIDYSIFAMLIYDFFDKLINGATENTDSRATQAKSVNPMHTHTFTREQIIEAVRYANLQEIERKSDGVPRGFVLRDKLKDSMIDNAINKYAPGATADSVIAMRDATLFGSGKEGTLVTDSAVYHYYPKNANPVILSKVDSVETIDETHLLVRYTDSVKEEVYYGRTMPLVYDFLVKLLGQN